MAFQPARYCLEYPVLSYLLVLRSEQTGVFINISLGANDHETEVTLDPQDGLEENQKYVYTVTAVNSIGTTTSYQDEKLRKYKCYCAIIHFFVTLL